MSSLLFRNILNILSDESRLGNKMDYLALTFVNIINSGKKNLKYKTSRG
jgi:hypothetical protein